MSCDKDYIGMSFGYSGRDGANPSFRHEFHTNFGTWIDLLEIINQLSKILDAVDVVMRRG